MQANRLRMPPDCHIPPKRSISRHPPLFRHRPWHFDIESLVLIVAHYSQPLEPMLNLNQPFQHIAINNNLPLTAFSQRLQIRGIQTDLLRQIGKEFSVYDLSFISVCPLNFNKPGRIKSVHQVFILKYISHLVAGNSLFTRYLLFS